MSRAFKSLILCLALIPSIALAWWNDDWKSRKQITLDASITGADIKETLTEFPVLVRLHAGNFGYFSELAENGKDLRFMADDKTPLKFQIDKFDAINEIALVWVSAPKISGGAASDTFYMYYGNADAPAPDAGTGVFDKGTALVYHFDDKNPTPQDGTANNNHAASSGALPDPAGWIGPAAKFSGAGAIVINPTPSLAINPANGWTFTTWIKIDQPQPNATIVKAGDASSALELLVRNSTLVARYTAGGKTVETPAAPAQMGKWSHVGLVLRADKLELFVEGSNTGEVPVAAVASTPTVTLGGNGASGFLVGALDEVQISTVGRSVDWLKLSARSQSPDFTVVGLGGDEGKDSGGGESSFGTIVRNVTIDGWVVIGLTGLMFIMAMIVMVIKIIVLARVRKDNKAFMAEYDKLGVNSDITQLDQEETEDDKELEDSDFLSAIAGNHDHYQSSPLYHIYHAGVRELNKRVGVTKKPLTPEAMQVIQASLDGIMTRETQRLNSKMVLLSIAIAGGPYLGLLGTVVGVMITFAVIAASGDVNINAIAPGIAAALLATVAGLAVAIPALFAYNYLTVQIKDVIADMRVFSDEFLAMIAEKTSDHFRSE